VPLSAESRPESHVEIRTLRRADARAAAALLATAMAETPTSIAVHGGRRAQRHRELEPVFATMLRGLGSATLVGYAGNQLVAIVGLAPPGHREVPPLRFVPALVRGRAPLSHVWRFYRWRRAWRSRELAAPHWHVGPVAVARDRQGHGIGSRIMAAACAEADRAGGVMYLETDSRRNVTFYERHGFVVVDVATVLGSPNWFMRRPAA
jgi:GNAT superfamily N-acetyltransferase